MSLAWAGGSTRAWRKLREQVLARDGHRCQIITNHLLGHRCGMPATHAGHIIAKSHGGPDTMDNLRAECEHHSAAAGTSIARAHVRQWAW